MRTGQGQYAGQWRGYFALKPRPIRGHQNLDYSRGEASNLKSTQIVWTLMLGEMESVLESHLPEWFCRPLPQLLGQRDVLDGIAGKTDQSFSFFPSLSGSPVM